jgi:D-sedoheptulose 7-phosphate isomerase
MRESVVGALRDAEAALAALLSNEPSLAAIAAAGTLFADALGARRRVFSCGNGGSLCDAMHFAEECSGRFRASRPALPAIAIADSGHISCAANDFGWEKVFSRYLEAHGEKGDVLLAISTSGTSPNVIEAARTARSRGIKVVALTGKPNSELAAFADVEICTPAGKYSDRVQELHIKVIHILIEIIERRLWPELYAEARA